MAPPLAKDGDPEAPITAADAKRTYYDFLRAVRSGDAKTACGLMTEDYQATFVNNANTQTNRVSGPDCESVIKQSEAALNAFVPQDAKVTFTDFAANGDTARITATLGTNDPETVRLERDGGVVKFAADE